MIKYAICLFTFLALSLSSLPAKADTTIYISKSRPVLAHHVRRHEMRVVPLHSFRDYDRYRHNYRRHEGFPVRYVVRPFSRIIFLGEPRTVVVTPAMVQPVFQPAPLQASPASADFVDASGNLCRAYQADAVIGGALQSVYGTACLQPDGAWRVVD